MNEISCRITNTFLNYVRNTKAELLKPLLEGLPYNESYLSNPDNWIPWHVERVLEDRLACLFGDDTIMFKIGRSILTLKSLGIVNIVLNLFMTPERLIRYSPRIAKYFTKDIVRINVIDASKREAIVELRIQGRQTRGACLFNQGMFSITTELFGLGPAEISEVQCVIPAHELGGAGATEAHSRGHNNTIFGAESCIYHMKWKHRTGWFVRKLAGSKQALEDALQHLEENHAKLEKAYQHIRKSEEKYRDLMENASDIICLLDADGRITSLNKKGLELLGSAKEEVAGLTFLSLVDDPHTENFALKFRESLRGITAVSELGLKIKDGGRAILSINSTPILEDGSVKGIMLIARDITREQEMTERLMEAERFAAKGMVAAEIAHEINNSLANIETALFIINNIRIDRVYRQDILKDVRDEILRMSGIVKGILEVYHSDNSVIQSVDINAEILKVINITLRRLKGKGISISPKLAPELPPVSCYPGHVKQVLLNLIKNAEEATDPHNAGLISIATGEDGDFIRMCVSDNGCGIPGELMDSIFSPLFTSKEKGGGLGLSICREIIKKYDGDITVESAEGKGTSVTVSLRKNGHG